ncbi:hypothetical protein BCR32DRAFT_271122 [Anaeromyces robustus]|uniref:Bromodomain associated domain-containing protein n=1 Tax=Anaeromyces robustus TaxID=1754192 RepID=A0A1Y1WTG6_9FUNG|nr:hypothetical protein BCR32DRAFT_271122 [Anaeromyces robustus]|eukprot:ORX76685.1 hypothetical protein BCR32DRAFT_271122 [Anaeromyces robustus]
MDKYLEQIAFNYISLILNSVGFEKANKSTCEVLEEIYCKYLEKLGRELKRCSEHHGTTEVSIEDLVYYFEDAGIKCKDLESILQHGIQLRNKKNNSKLLLQISNNRENLKLMLSQLENEGRLINYDELLEKPILIKQNMDILGDSSEEEYGVENNNKKFPLLQNKENDNINNKKESIKKIVEE